MTWLLKYCIVYGGERALAVVVLPLCVPVCLYYIDSHLSSLKNVGTTEQQSKKNLIAWINAMITSNCSKIIISRDRGGYVLEGCFEGMLFSDLQKVIAVFSELHEWRAKCVENSISAGRFLAITGNKLTMTIS